jgi:hypothetical protein
MRGLPLRDSEDAPTSLLVNDEEYDLYSCSDGRLAFFRMRAD